MERFEVYKRAEFKIGGLNLHFSKLFQKVDLKKNIIFYRITKMLILLFIVM